MFMFKHGFLTLSTKAEHKWFKQLGESNYTVPFTVDKTVMIQSSAARFSELLGGNFPNTVYGEYSITAEAIIQNHHQFKCTAIIDPNFLLKFINYVDTKNQLLFE